MTYPAHSGLLGHGSSGFTTARNVTFGYGTANMPDDVSERIASITMGSGSTSLVASFSYTGSGRRVGLKLGGTSSSPRITQSFDTSSGGGIEGLDRFGRMLDLFYKNTASSDSTLWRGEYGYDASGNRTYEKLTQRPPSTSINGTNTRSRLFGYDKLDRLLGVKSGELDLLSTDIAIAASDAYPHVRKELWNLDLMGNWSGVERTEPGTWVDPCVSPGGGGPGDEMPEPGPGGVGAGTWYSTTFGHTVSFDGTPPSGTSEVFERQHPAEAPEMEESADQLPSEWMTNLHANAMRVMQYTDPYATPDPMNSYGYHRADPSGNTVFDGDYFYQYDAWNRLVQINKRGSLEWVRFPYAPVGTGSFDYFVSTTSLPAACLGSDVGELVKHFTYDGVGRLIRVSSPIDAGEGFFFASNNATPATTFTRSERFYYDGTRRIQERITDPVVVSEEDGDVPLLGDEEQQGNWTVPNQYTVSYIRAQYVWGPGDGTNGADELLCQLDPRDTSVSSYSSGGGKPWYILTDAQGDVVSIAHVPAGSNTVAEVGGQWTHSPYGEVLTYEEFHPHPAVVFGHKTLAVDRLDEEALSWSVGTGAAETKRLMPGARLFSYARNRTLDSKHGRWLQLDPNASGATLLGSTAFHGAASTAMAVVDVESRTMDGVGLYRYAASSPIVHSDHFGLYSTDQFAEDFYGSNFSMPTPSSFLTGALSSMVTAYAANQDWDVDWATDWVQGDDWSTRTDDSWVLESFVQGIYDCFEFGWGEYKVNALDGISDAVMASSNPATSQGSQNAGNKNKQRHHIATQEGGYKKYFEIEFKKAGMTLNDPENLVRIPHGGRHPREYHEYILKRVRAAVSGKTPDAAKVALKAELKDIGTMIKSNAFKGFIYNSAGGKKTGWKGLRDKFAAKWKVGGGGKGRR